MINFYFNTIDDITSPIFQNFRKIRNPQIKLWISSTCQDRTINKLVKGIDIIDDNIELDNNVNYYEWNLDNTQTNQVFTTGLKSVIYRNRIHNTDFVIIDSTPKSKKQLVAFIDATKKENLPDKFYKFKCYSTIDDVFSYCQENGVFDFSLKDTIHFRPTGKQMQGAEIYECILDIKDAKKGWYLYLDNLHKTHYEVFDSTDRKYLGEMSLDGKLDKSKAGQTKKTIDK